MEAELKAKLAPTSEGSGRSTVLDTPAYKDHELVKAACAKGEQRPLPLGIYLDGVRVTAPLAGRYDSVIFLPLQTS